MKSAFVHCGLLLALACGRHDTAVAVYQASLPDGGASGSAGTGASAGAGASSGVGASAGGGGSAGTGASAGAEAGGAGAPAGPACLETYPLEVDGLGSRYREELSTRRSWVDAERDCEADGGHLVVIDDQAENDWLKGVATRSTSDSVSSNQLTWLGLGDQLVEGEFRWVSGGPLATAHWASMEPNSLYHNEDCVEIRASGDWNDDHCDALLTYVCECDGASATDKWCDTLDEATCGDCQTACAPDQVCSGQACEAPP